MERFQYNVEEKEDGFYAVATFDNPYLSDDARVQKEGPYSTQEQAERTLKRIKLAVDTALKELDELFQV